MNFLALVVVVLLLLMMCVIIVRNDELMIELNNCDFLFVVVVVVVVVVCGMTHAKINTWNLLQPSPHMSTITALRTTHGASCRWAGARPLSPIWQQVAESQLVSCVAAHATWRGRFFKRPAEERPPVLRGVGPAAVPRVRIHQNDVSGGKLEPRRPSQCPPGKQGGA